MKKSIILAGVLGTLMINGVTGFAEGDSNNVKFKDIENHWAKNQILNLIEKDIIKGVQEANGEYSIKPNENISRAEFLAVIVKSNKLSKMEGQAKTFKDVDENAWYKEYVDIATSNNLVNGYPDGRFKPQAPLTRGELATIVAKVNMWNIIDGEDAPAQFKYDDVDKEHWSYNGILINAQRGIMSGYEDGTFKNNRSTTRAEAFTVISKYLAKDELVFSDNEITCFIQTTISRANSMLDFKSEEDRVKFWENNMKNAKKDALNQLKDFKVHLLKIKEKGFELTNEDKEKIDKFFKSTISELGGEEKANQIVKMQVGLNIEEYKVIYKDMILISNFVVKEQEKIKVRIKDMEKYYEENKPLIGKTTVRHILFSILDQETMKPLSKEELDKAKQMAEETLEKVRNNEDMESLAIELSEDPGVKTNKGVYEVVYKSNFVPEFKEWAINSELGDSDIVETQFGYHVMKAEAKSSFEDAEEGISRLFVQKRYQGFIDKWMKKVRFKKDIRFDD